MKEPLLLTTVPDEALLRQLAELLRDSRRTEADLVAHIGEVDKRRLYAREAAPSMFSYCTRVLHLSEAEAYLRIVTARAARKHPVLLAMLADGRLHLSGIAKLKRHLTPENRDAILGRATHRSKRQIEELIAEICPRPDAPTLMRKLPQHMRSDRAEVGASPSGQSTAGQAPVGQLTAGQPTSAVWKQVGPDGGHALGPDGVDPLSPGGGELLSPDRVGPTSLPVPRAVVEPLAPSRYKVQFTASAELRDKLERLQALLRSEVPEGDLGAIIDRAVTDTLQRLEARRYARRSPTRGTTTAKRTTIGPQATAATNSLPREPSTRVTSESRSSLSPRPGTRVHARHIPAALRRVVYERDAGRCRYVDARGRRCEERHRLEYHHVHPFGLGGEHALENIVLMCRTHNLYLAEREYGVKAIAPYRRPIEEVAGRHEERA